MQYNNFSTTYYFKMNFKYVIDNFLNLKKFKKFAKTPMVGEKIS